jgi:hypothetical protein
MNRISKRSMSQRVYFVTPISFNKFTEAAIRKVKCQRAAAGLTVMVYVDTVFLFVL